MSLFDRDITLLAKSLDLRARRNTLLASNVANVETPGFKAKDLLFEDALAKALDSQQPGPMQTTNPRHLDGRQSTPLLGVKGEVILASNPVGSVDGNSVDLEKEMAKLAENQVAYQALTEMISRKFSMLRAAVREGEL